MIAPETRPDLEVHRVVSLELPAKCRAMGLMQCAGTGLERRCHSRKLTAGRVDRLHHCPVNITLPGALVHRGKPGTHPDVEQRTGLAHAGDFGRRLLKAKVGQKR